MPYVSFEVPALPRTRWEGETRCDEPDERSNVPGPPRSVRPGRRLVHLQQAYRDTGGLITGDSFAALLRAHCDQPISLIARQIVDGRVVSFDACGQRWLPRFQFDPPTLRPRREIEPVIAEFRGVFDDTELAEWFAAPNALLDGASPAAVLASDPLRVLQAARADRFVAVGL